MKREPHAFRQIAKGVTILACRKCGLVPLKNPLTAWALQVGCDYDEHPDLKRITKQLGKPNASGY